MTVMFYKVRQMQVLLTILLGLGGAFSGGFLEYKESQECFKEQRALVEELQKEEFQLAKENNELREELKSIYDLPPTAPFTNSGPNLNFGRHSN